jgi:hypothetical protein
VTYRSGATRSSQVTRQLPRIMASEASAWGGHTDA